MRRKLVIISRKWWGYGGMQQYSRDLWQTADADRRVQVVLCRPGKNVFSIFFPFQVLLCGIYAQFSGAAIHLTDGALCTFGYIFAKFFRIPVCITLHGLDVLYPKRWYQLMLQRCLPFAETIVCVSEATAILVRDRFSENSSVIVIPNGIITNDNFQVAEKSPAPLLVSVGRLIPRKGFAWFITQVLPELVTQYSALQYVLIGYGPERKVIEQAVRSAGVEKNVTLLGNVSPTERDELFAAAWASVMPNISTPGDTEGFGIVALESAMLGTPVVAADTDGIADAVIENRTGRLYQSGNPEDCIRVVSELLSEPMDATEVQAAVTANFSWKELLDRYLQEVWGFEPAQ